MLSVPVLLRVAGLPAAVLDPLRSEPCRHLLQEIATIEGPLAERRAGLAERLFPAVPGAPPRLRRLLLAVRRDCFGGRSLGGHRDAPGWDEVRLLGAGLVDGILDLEVRAAAARRELERIYPAEWERAAGHLIEVLAEPGLRRGLALASPVLAARIGGLEGPKRRERRLLLSGLRYASRAALKLSPFSTLTRVALGCTVEDGAPVRFLGGEKDWQERSVVRLRRHLVQQLAEAVAACPAVRDRLPLALNSSLTPLDDGARERWILVRPAHWETTPDGSGRRPGWRWIPPTPVEVPLAPALVVWLEEQLAAGDLDPAELAARLAASLGERAAPGRAAGSLLKLVRLGVLLRIPPWDTTAPRLEEALRDALAAGPPALRPISDALSRLIELEDGFATAGDPGASAAGIAAALEEARRAASRLANTGAGLVADAGGATDRVEKTQVERAPAEVQAYEDVVLLGPGSKPAGSPPAGALGHEIAEVHGGDLRKALASLSPWLRLTDLFDPRHEVLRALAAVLRQRWPSGGTVSALELFRETRGFWQPFREILARPLAWPPERTVFDPLGLPAVAALQEQRQVAWEGLGRLLARDVDAQGPLRLAPSDLTALLAGLPVARSPAIPLIDPCLFLQPAGGSENLWVLNRLFEGTGRYASRAVTALPADYRRALADTLTAASTLTLPDGTEADLLDLLFTHGDTLNVHVPQTRKVLEMPGERVSLSTDRRVRLADLLVRLDRLNDARDTADSGLPYLCDRNGRRLLPVHLGGAALAFLPHLMLFLSVFGPGELRPFPLPRRPHQSEQSGPSRPSQILHRTILERVVLARKRWLVPAAGATGFTALAADLAALSPPRALVAIDRWRRLHGLPERLFVIERVSHPAVERIFKPQYLDFASPLFCELFRALLGKAVRQAGGSDAALILEEALPDPGDLPRDAAGQPWAVEVQVEPLLLGRGSGL